ncbi:tegument protein VP22 [Chimpanzee herpesvirus strain 105640]|uniref:Tegument protein VP22 n=1 Tax=Chimpanzee herpesvirus strain 105640 TaxID=332937 RepID=Q3C1X6_9ALPH|nr:tegument protein VP22 [Chimpanzee herpesvirus strain 105640]AFV26938.1 tegument protein VP22 [Chimpanzee herpesvirus strain 105640]BAE47066.1 tegument protein (VP22) [Chimpanzee herpesvirus strain 105640]
MTSRRSVKSCPREAPRGTHEEFYYGPVSPADPESPRDDFRRGTGQTRAHQRGEVRFVHYDEAGYALYRDSSSSDDESRDTTRPRRSASAAGSHGPGPTRAPPPGAPVGRSHAPTARTPKMTRGAPKAPATPAPDPVRGRRPAQAESAALLDAPAPMASGRPKTSAQGLAKKLHFSTAPPSPTAPWTPRVAGFNKRVFCAAVGRLAATHARLAAVQLWDMSRPHTDEDLNELLDLTTIRVTVCEGKNLLQRANELVNPDAAQDADATAAARGRPAGRVAATGRPPARSASRPRRPLE